MLSRHDTVALRERKSEAMINRVAVALRIAELCDSRQSPQATCAPGGFAVLIDCVRTARLPGRRII